MGHGYLRKTGPQSSACSGWGTRRAGSPVAAAAKCGKDLWEGPVRPDLAVQGITIIFTSLNTDLTRGTKEKHLKVKGPVQMYIPRL